MQTNNELELAYNFIQFTGQNIFLTGKAGTGKTTFLKQLKQRLPKRMIVVAPTGVAAINAGGVTIHSFFQLSFGPQLAQENARNQQMRFTKKKINIIRSIDLLVIDEISMVRADVLDGIDRVMRRFKNRRKPFGGAQLLMIGDLQQLAPIVKKEEWELLKKDYNTAFFFSSKTLRETPYVSIELTQVFRQQDENFLSILNKVRENTLDASTQKALNERYQPDFNPHDKEGYITLCTHNAQAQRINGNKLRELDTETYEFEGRVEGNFPEYAYPTDLNLQLKIGAQVMFVKNDPDVEKRFYNGKIGRITNFDDKTAFVQCPGEDEEIEVSPLVWENIKYSIDTKTAEIKEEVEGSFSQIPLKLAWAITIHKSQGLTFERAIIDAESSFAHGQVYVALSRCKSLDGLVLKTPIENHSIITNSTVDGFIRNVEENPPGQTELDVAKQAYQREELLELFRFYRANYLVNAIGKIMEENKGSFTEVWMEQFRKMRDQLRTELAEVGDKFQHQIESHLRKKPLVESNADLQERIKKAAAYFSDKVQEVLINPLKKADWDIDNRAIQKQIHRRLDELLTEAKTKQLAYEISKNEFSVTKIMDARVKAMMEQDSAKPKKQKAQEVEDPFNIPHPELYKLLRSWRYEKATELKKPAFYIFSQKTLLELVTYLPSTKATLKLINGLGKRKIEQFGDDISELIREYCEENAINVEEIPLKKNSAKEQKPKIDTKKVSLEMYQAGKTIAKIAHERRLTENTITNHLGHFIKIGELDVHSFVTKEKLDKIVDYFNQNEDQSLTQARHTLGEEVSFENLKIGLNHYKYINKK